MLWLILLTMVTAALKKSFLLSVGTSPLFVRHLLPGYFDNKEDFNPLLKGIFKRYLKPILKNNHPTNVMGTYTYTLLSSIF